MTAIRWMILTCLGVWLAVSLAVPRALAVDLGWGMLGPLAASVVSCVLLERAARRDLARVSPLLMQLFALKMAFFAAYVVLMLRGLAVQPTPFILSFSVTFLALLATEAMLVRRLQGSAAAMPQAGHPQA